VGIQLGRQIQNVLKGRRGLNQATLARLAQIDRGRFARIVHNEVTPSMDELQRIARVLGVKASFLLEETYAAQPAPRVLNSDLIRVLKNPDVVVNFRLLGELDEEDQKTVARVIESFAKKPLDVVSEEIQ
jgi:transcriptional regulator with XRE-family HTH domain